jgi:hypothetical protein
MNEGKLYHANIFQKKTRMTFIDFRKSRLQSSDGKGETFTKW